LYPRARIQYILADSQSSVIVTNSRNRALAGELAGAEVAIANLDEMDAGISDANLDLSISPGSPNAIYYTSGSTGQPKGVIRVNRNTLHDIMNQTNAYHICPEDRICLTASQCYAASGTDTFGALLNGACLLPFDLKAEGLGNLAEWLDGQEITISHLVPTVFRNFATCLPKDRRFPKLRLLLFGGETVCKRDIQLCKEHFSEHCLVRCGFSVTETQGAATLLLIDQRTEIAGSIVPAGYGVQDKEIWILDENRNRIGCNEAGEIAVRSRYLSPGYWKKPELTRASFLPDPAGGDVRIYLTGDLGRLSPDGCLEHLGRKDMQVKVRGIKIELMEVEAVLLDIPEVKESAVVAREDARGDKRLVAYVVAAQGERFPSVGRLRAALMKSLPAQAVPSAFVFLDSLPTTPNGKVDRLALPEPPPERPPLDSVCLAPRNAVEERLARIWGNVLGVEPIGVQDNFFELGGHSLAAARLFAEIEEVFGKSLPLPLLLQAPTIEQLAAALRRDGRDEPGTFITGIQAKGSRPPLFCVETLNAGIFVHLARRLGPEQPCYGLHPLGLPRSRKPRVSIESLAARYLEEVRKVQPKGPYFLCGMCTGGVVAYEMAQQLKARGDEVAFLALLDTFSPPARWLNYASLCPGWGFIERRVRRGSGDVRDLSQPQSDGQAAYVRQLARPEPGFIAQQFQRGAKHLRNLSQLTLDGQAAYVRRLAAGRAARVEAARGLNKYLRQLAAYSRTLLRAGGRAGRWYRPKLYQGRLILFLANETTPRLRHGARLAWRELATGGAEVYSVPGVHELILSEPNVRVLAGYFKAHLEEAQTSARGPRT
jgi:acyl-coenzyme A synthetase/AMP-(fatty) acid ligase/thioesterase domain-containing protein/acyl carrier protein